MNKKGFTLVELLAVIAILGILSILVVVNISGIKNSEDEENNKNVISSILAGAKRYVADNPDFIDDLGDINADGNTIKKKEINIADLVNNNYVDYDNSQKSLFDNKTVEITTCDDNLRVKYEFEGYNDCGCDDQGSENIDTLCEEQN